MSISLTSFSPIQEEIIIFVKLMTIYGGWSPFNLDYITLGLRAISICERKIPVNNTVKCRRKCFVQKRANTNFHEFSLFQVTRPQNDQLHLHMTSKLKHKDFSSPLRPSQNLKWVPAIDTTTKKIKSFITCLNKGRGVRIFFRAICSHIKIPVYAPFC